MRHFASNTPTRARVAAALGTAMLGCVLAWPAAVSAAAVYRWVDADGVTHLSSEKPPAGVEYERLDLGAAGVSPGKSAQRSRSTSSTGGPARLAAVSPEQVARRNAAIRELQNRECVVALEAMDRLARGGRPVEPTEFKRLQQTADRNCSKEPALRREQEDMAARLRVAKGDVCVEARDRLAEMLEPGRMPSREQLKTQQQFIESHCEAPVR
jgi:hypothetical protein